MKNYNKQIGTMGENIAYDYLTNHGYIILDRNFRCRYGEIDLIGKNDNCISFIEVKCRYTNLYGLPKESVTFYKQSKIYKTAEFYIFKKKLLNYNFRFDVVEVALNFNNNNSCIHLIKNAFQV